MPSLREGVHVPGHLRPRMVVFPRPMVSDGSALGHEERFPPPRLNAGCGFRKETIAEIRRNGRDAPIVVLAESKPAPQLAFCSPLLMACAAPSSTIALTIAIVARVGGKQDFERQFGQSHPAVMRQSLRHGTPPRHDL